MSDPLSKNEQRVVIKFLTLEKHLPPEIHQRMCSVYGDSVVVSLHTVERWHKKFAEGHTSVDDEARSGRLSDMIDEMVRCVRALLEEDRRYTITDLRVQMAARYSEASFSTVHTALTQYLEMRKVCARWVPQQLSDDDQARCLGWALEFLTQFHALGNNFLECIITGDESWIHFWTPETKEQSKVWKRKEEETLRKFKTIPSAGKVMLTVFWDHHGPIYWEFSDGEKSSITQETYFDTLNHLRNAIKLKRPGLLSWKVCLLHDNAQPHTARLIQFLLEDFKWIVFPHSPYSPNLAPIDYHLFPRLKKELGGKRFATRAYLIAKVECILKNLDGSFYREGIEKLMYQLDKCLQKGGDYVEK